MAYETETEYSTIYYRCIDPIENLRIKVILQPVKSLYIPLPQFDVKQSSSEVSSNQEEKEIEKEEYIFRWQEKILSKKEISEYSSKPDWIKKVSEKYQIFSIDRVINFQDYSNKIFSYVEVDNFSIGNGSFEIFTEKIKYSTFLSKKMNNMNLPRQNIKNYKNIEKRNVVNYYPSEEFKNEAHLPSNNIQRMFIMLDLSLEGKETKTTGNKHHCEGILCTILYDYATNVLQITPSFTKSKVKPYMISSPNQDTKNSYYYWIYHTSQNYMSENLTKEIHLMSKVFEHQEELRNLQIDKEFFIGRPDHCYVTVLCEIISTAGFEYNNLHIHYFINLPPNWSYSDTDLLKGKTQSSYKNSEGVCHFSHLFEMNLCVEFKLLDDPSSPLPELFFEVLSVDKYNRFRNEGYTYVSLPRNPGMYSYSLKCWRLEDNSIRSKLNRFFIGGGIELEEVSCLGLCPSENGKVMSRFGTKTVPEGELKVKLSILHQSKMFIKKSAQPEAEKYFLNRLDSGSLLGSINSVLEAFRRARERMLVAKKGLQMDLNYIFLEENENGEKKSDIKKSNKFFTKF